MQLFVAQRHVCHVTKYETKQQVNLLQPLHVSTAIWEDLSLDFIIRLPFSRGHYVILVVVERFSKSAHFGALPLVYSTYKVSIVFLDILCIHHKLPHNFVSYWDPIFNTMFCKELLKFPITHLIKTTSYHPETGGQTEVTNKTL